MLLTKKEIYKHRHNGKVTIIAEIKYEPLVQYEQHYAGIERKLPIFEKRRQI